MKAGLAFIALVAAASVGASAAAGSVPRRSSSRPFISSTTAGPARISFQTTETAIQVGSGFSYRATVRSSVPLDFLQVRMRLFMPGGRLIYQKTYVDTSKKVEPKTFGFERAIDDIDLDPDAYPTELSVRVVVDGKESTSSIRGALLVYDPKTRPRPVCLVARISALPLSDPQGRFVLDPAANVRARDDVIRLTDYVLGSASARLTVSLSPMMLEEWGRISRGYTYESPEGPIDVAVTDEVPRTYKYALSRLSNAVATGRLEVLGCGYSDPDLWDLEAAGLSEDIAAQYDRGISAVFGSIGATPSAGTAPANGRFSGKTLRLLASQSISYALLSDRYTENSVPGAYAVKGSKTTVFVYDQDQQAMLATSSAETGLASIFGCYLKPAGGPIPVVVTVGRMGVSADRVIRLALGCAA